MKVQLSKNTDPYIHEPIRTLESRCYHCGKFTITPLNYVMDAEAIAWKERYYKLLGSLNETLKFCMIKHGTDPMYEEMKEALIKLREEYT